jgi:zinc/manganese transport system permease protein
MWAGLAIAYLAPVVPPSFGILGVATTVYLATFAWPALNRRRGAGATGAAPPATAAGAGGVIGAR